MVEESRKRTLVDEDGEVERKRFSRGNEPLLKLLVPNVIAGVLIGKGGSFLSELKSKYGGYIRLSGNREYYPGTEERVIVITGKVSEIIDINHYIMEKTTNTGREPLRDGRGDKVKIVVTNLSAGMLIGRGGATIKAIQESCQVKISIADSKFTGVEGERVLTMSGSLDQRSEAFRQVIEKIAEEPGNMANTNTKYNNIAMNAGLPDNDSFSGMQQNGNHQLPPGNRQPGGNNIGARQSRDNRQDQNHSFSSLSGNSMSRFLGNMPSSLEKRDLGSQLFSVLSGNSLSGLQGENRMAMGGATNKHSTSKFKSKAEVELEVPNIMVGLLMGKQGQNIKDFVHRSGGARFRFSNKDEYVEGTTDRTLTITGNMDQVQIAYNLVHDKAEEFRQANY